VHPLEAEYLLRPGFAPTTEQIDAFHSVNAIFNCWPFFRELISSMCVRMRIPVFLIPPLRIEGKADPSKGLSQNN